MSTADEHGGALDAMRRRFPNAPEPWIDLSTGINPWPWPTAGHEFGGLHRLPTRLDRERCAEAGKVDAVVICNPNNPDGRRFPWTQSHLRIGLPKDAAAEARLQAALSA